MFRQCYPFFPFSLLLHHKQEQTKCYLCISFYKRSIGHFLKPSVTFYIENLSPPVVHISCYRHTLNVPSAVPNWFFGLPPRSIRPLVHLSRTRGSNVLWRSLSSFLLSEILNEFILLIVLRVHLLPLLVSLFYRVIELIDLSKFLVIPLRNDRSSQ